MEAALVGVGTGVMKPLLSKLFKALKEEHSKLKGVRREVEGTREEMSNMQAALEALADAEQLDHETRAWRDDVRELSFDMEDCLDDFMARADTDKDGPKGLKGFFGKLTKLKPRHVIAGEIKKLKARAIETSKRHQRYKSDRQSSNSTTCDIDPRLNALYVDVGKLVGIDGPKNHIIEVLKNEDSSSTQLHVLSIVGAGGLGKTTLSNVVYQTIKKPFDSSAFVSVSRKPNMRNVLREIAKGLKITHNTSDDGVHPLIDTLREHLKNKKYLVVVDDIWSTEAWKTIRDALPNNDCGSRIITTTRNSTVASLCSPQGDYVYRMEPLSSADSRRLFLERAFHSEDLFPPTLEEISKKILEKCPGLPLAIITLSSMLADEPAEEVWKRVLDAIGSSLAKEAVVMTKILSLSYFDLPHPLRSCLLYLSAFPEDHIIDKRSLIHKWIAEGFIHEAQGRSAYEVGRDCLNELINKSLIQPIANHQSDELSDEVAACRVHDIVLDFIICKAEEENFMTSLDDGKKEKRHKVRRLSVVSRANEMDSVSGDLSHVRSLAMFGYSALQFPAIGVLDFPVLRVLDIGECEIVKGEQMANIEKLLLLKYLRVGAGLISTTELLGGIGKLKYLETLDMRGVEIAKLPSSMTRLQRLVRLYAYFKTSCLSDGIIGQLKNLEELEHIMVLDSELDKFLQELCQLTKLRMLSVTVIDQSDSVENKAVVRFIGTLISSYNIHHLRISQEPCSKNQSEGSLKYNLLPMESWCPANPSVFRNIDLHARYIEKIPSWMISLGNLRGLDLSMCRMGLEDMANLGRIPALTSLKLGTFYGRNGRIFIRGFRYLKYFNLKLWSCGTSMEFEEGSMPKLEVLELHFAAHTMECVSFGIQHLSALTKVDLFIDGTDDIKMRFMDLWKLLSGSFAAVLLSHQTGMVVKVLNQTVSILKNCSKDCTNRKPLILINTYPEVTISPS
ncbi:disease resistance protein RGA5-like [Triticum dicoccoides]|uniref:disease resistance protein RGA5-like n=1 Tax=Triticum dicoccoides TaxID=85692 RepID=UPI00188E9ACF|nr:disease resistance protein RGA5-like [Triticum dicoccoides]